MSHKKDSLRDSGHKAVQVGVKPTPPKNLWKMLDEALEDKSTRNIEKPSDSLTSAEYAKEYGISKTTARNRLALLLEQGIMTRQAFIIKGPADGSARRTYCYSFVEKGDDHAGPRVVKGSVANHSRPRRTRGNFVDDR